MRPYLQSEDTIAALATPAGTGAIAVLRVSGPEAFAVVQRCFEGKNLADQEGNTVHYGYIKEGDVRIDEVLVTVFKAPRSYTKEDSLEISCHGSPYIAGRVLHALMLSGARLAGPGEYTFRAFRNGRFDLSQAEAVADMIASDSDAGLQLALHQLRGGFSKKIARLRSDLIHFASLLELELDFSEEDVEFADRTQLKALVHDLLGYVGSLADSFRQGNSLKQGVATVLAGKPNAGKSTLLNALLQDERAIVSEIPGTTRDVIEDAIQLEGIRFRLMDTAGLREATDTIERLGIERSMQKIEEAALVLYIVDASVTSAEEAMGEIAALVSRDMPLLLVANKWDLCDADRRKGYEALEQVVCVSGKEQYNIDALERAMLEAVQLKGLHDKGAVSNVRHWEALEQTRQSLARALVGLSERVTTDFVAQDIRQSLHYLGLISGEVSTDDLLENIFSKFCIGK